MGPVDGVFQIDLTTGHFFKDFSLGVSALQGILWEMLNETINGR